MAKPKPHRCKGTDDDDRPLKPERVSCGICGRAWCERCDPFVAAAGCHWCHGGGGSSAELPREFTPAKPRKRKPARPRGCCSGCSCGSGCAPGCPTGPACGSHPRPRCAACGALWPCRTPGGEHVSTGELAARVAAADRKPAPPPALEAGTRWTWRERGNSGRAVVVTLEGGYPVVEEGYLPSVPVATLIAAAPELRDTLARIAGWEYRADRRHRGMVDVSEIESLKRIARTVLARFGERGSK